MKETLVRREDSPLTTERYLLFSFFFLLLLFITLAILFQLIVLSGKKVFCSGYDLKKFAEAERGKSTGQSEDALGPIH